MVVAGGSGDRFGGPKQFAEIDGRAVLDWSAAAARQAVDGVVIVIPSDALRGSGEVAPFRHLADAVVEGGATRAGSVRAGLAAVPDEVDIVVVHDAVRPLATPALFEEVIAAVAGPDGAAGAVPVLPVTDTVKQVSGTTVVTTMDRSTLVTVQTPQAFRAAVLRKAHADQADATDDAGLLEAMGEVVVTVPGEAGNIKVTEPGDLARVRWWVSRTGEEG